MKSEPLPFRLQRQAAATGRSLMRGITGGTDRCLLPLDAKLITSPPTGEWKVRVHPAALHLPKQVLGQPLQGGLQLAGGEGGGVEPGGRPLLLAEHPARRWGEGVDRQHNTVCVGGNKGGGVAPSPSSVNFTYTCNQYLLPPDFPHT